MKTHTLDKYAPALLDTIDSQAAKFNETGRGADNPRWLIATCVAWLPSPTFTLVSSQNWDKGAGVAIPIDPKDGNAWGKEGAQYFRTLKHAYLDALGISGGMPKDHAFRRGDDFGELSDKAAALIAKRTAPKPEPPKGRPKAGAHDKDRDLSQRIARAGVICSTSEARTLRRAALTLHRWHELECGTDAGHIERDGDNGDGRPYFVPCGRWYGGRYVEPKRRPILDRERDAIARIAATCAAMGLNYYVQGDPRGCSLYVSPEPLTPSTYSRGVAVY